MRPIFAGILGMLGAVLVSKGYDYFFPSDKRPFNAAILVIPWFLATIVAVNLGYRAGVADQKSKK